MQLQLITLMGALAVAGCGATSISNASPDGARITSAGSHVIASRVEMHERVADLHCRKYGEKAVFVDDARGDEVEFKCVPNEE